MPTVELITVSHSTNFHYRAYGLNVTSSFAIPELLPSTPAATNVVITLGTVPATLPGPCGKGLRYEAARGQLLLKVDRVARYLVARGRSIIVEPAPQAEEAAIRLFLLGPVLSALMHQREDLVLKGSAINVNGRAVVFLGASGAGKSTLAMGFSRRGYKVLTDDLAVVRPDEAGPRSLQPAFPHIRLWPDVLRHFELPLQLYPRVREELKKRTISISGHFEKQSLPVGRIYVLKSGPVEGIKLTALCAARAYNILQRNPQMSTYLSASQLDSTYCQMASTLVAEVVATEVEQSRRHFVLDKLMDQLESDFLK